MTVHPPGPRGPASLATLARIARGDLSGAFRDLAARYGPVSSFRAGATRIVLVNEPSLVEELLVTRQHAFVRDVGATLLRELVGEGLLTTEDPAHLARRRVMQPAFHRNHVATYASTIVAQTRRASAGWNDTDAFDIGAAMTRLTLAAVGEALFGDDVRGGADEIAEVLARVQQRGRGIGALLFVGAPILERLRRRDGGSRLFPRERADLERIVAPILARGHATAGGHDLLSLLLAVRDDAGDALGDPALLAEIVTLVLAGHETTAATLAWVWALLARHPAVERRLHDEVDRVLGEREPTVADVANLPVTAGVLAETLRLYPAAVAFARRPVAPLALGGYALAAGTSVYVSPYVTQRDGRFFDDPDAFRPERWDGAPPARFAYFPFGGGSKACIGEPFARLEATLVIAGLARRFRFEALETQALGIAPEAILRPSRPVLVRAHVRRRSSG